MKLFALKCLLVTLVTIALTVMLSQLANLRVFRLLFPETTAIDEFEFTDFAFDLTLPAEMNDKITVVNIGELDRGAIGDLIRNLSAHGPAVIGLDVFFYCPEGTPSSECPENRDPAATENLRRALMETENVVLISLPLQSAKLRRDSVFNQYDSLGVSDTLFSDHARIGHSLLSIEASEENELPSCRTFVPYITLVDGRKINAFGVEVARLYDSVATQKFLDKADENEYLINFKGNIVKYGLEDQDHFFQEARHFYALDPDQVLSSNFPPNLVADRIILLEYLGESLTHPASEKEKFYTPLNRKKIGRTYADMYPSVVHANIVNMIITEDYLYELGGNEELLLAFFICFFHVAALLAIRKRFPYLHDLCAVGLVIAIIAGTAIFRLLLFTELSIKSDLGFTIASLAVAGIVAALYHDLLDARLLKYLDRRVKKHEPQAHLSEVEE